MAIQIENDPNIAQTPEDPEAAERERVRKFITLALERFKLSSEAFSRIRADSIDDLKFSIGDQWPSDIRTQRDSDQRPCLTMNRLPQFIRQVTNEQRANRPGVQIRPAGNGASIEVAETIEGMIRHVHTRSDADIAFDTAFDNMVRGGIGWFRVLTEYMEEESFDQEIRVKRIKNPFTVYPDPSAVEPDFSDGNFLFIIEDMAAVEYRAKYPDSIVSTTLSDFSSIGNDAPGWGSRDLVRVAEYFFVEYEVYKIAKLTDGRIVRATEIEEGDVVEATREVVKRHIKWSKINAMEILEEKDWIGVFIPVIPAVAEDIDVNGTRHIAGLVRDAKDPMRMYNYWITSATETIALAPKAPYVGVEGQFEGRETIWQSANVKNYPYLEYKSVSVAGQPAPPPQRQQYEPPIQAMSVMIRQADNDLKATTGIYDASLGQHGPDESGKALMMRQKQSSIGNLNFSDNFNRSLRHLGRILVDLIPKVYDAPRVQRIIKPDKTVQHVGVYNSKISGVDSDSARSLIDESVQKIYDLGVGVYDVIVSTGASYESKRQEAAQSIMMLVQSYPNIMAVAGDLLVGNMDWAGAQEISARLKASLPPNLVVSEDEDPKTQVMQLQSRYAQLEQQTQLISQELAKANEALTTKSIERASQERIAAMNAQVQLIQTEAKIRGEAALKVLQQELDTIKLRIEHLNEAEQGDEQNEEQVQAQQ